MNHKQENQENQDEYNPFEETVENGNSSGEAAEGEAAEGEFERRHDGQSADAGEASAESQHSGGADDDPAQQLAQMKEAMLRLKAEMDNREKRLEREMTKTRKFALEALMRDLVPVLDSMDQAISSEEAGEGGRASEGMQLVRKQALQVMGSHGLEALDPEGEKFDPTWHEAMATQPSDEHAADTIVQVLQKGYRLNDRLIRPARVIVASSDGNSRD